MNLPNSFAPKRIGWRIRFWRERFELTESFCWRIPDALQSLVLGAVEAEFFAVRRFDDGAWYFCGRKGGQWDGATGVPTTDCVVFASWVHDMLYGYVREIAKSWYGADTWRNRHRVRKVGDRFFRHILRDEGSWARTIYPLGVRLLGGVWNEMGLLFR